MPVVRDERMLAYEGRFVKRGIVLHEHGLDRRPPAADEVPVSVASERAGTEPLTGGTRSLRVVEVLEAAERGVTRDRRAA